MNKTTGMSMIAVAGAVVLLLAGCQAAKTKPVIENTHETLSADALFAFDKSDINSLTDKARSQLDELVAKLRGATKINSVGLIGYTDRIGSKAYNDDLSLKRANAVRDYLVSHGVASNLITTEGRGQSDPVAACPQLAGQKLRDCLAPNRRVEVNIAVIR